MFFWGIADLFLFGIQQTLNVYLSFENENGKNEISPLYKKPISVKKWEEISSSQKGFQGLHAVSKDHM